MFEMILPLIPVVIVITLIVITKRIMESFVLALFLVFFIISPADMLTNLTDGIYVTLTGEVFSFLLVVTALLGGNLRLITESGGANGFAKLLEKMATSRPRALLATYLAGIIVFIDEYLNALVVTASMRTLTDKFNTPRVMLACTVNSVGVPLCMFTPISIWAAFYISLMYDNGLIEEFDMAIGIPLYLKVIPFMIFPIVYCLVFLLLLLGKLPLFGPMKTAFKRADETGDLFPASGRISEYDTSDREGNILFFATPIVTMIVVILITMDFFIAGIISVAVNIAMLLATKKMTIRYVGDQMIEGVKDMAFVLTLILIIFTFVDALKDIGMVEVAVTAVSKFATPATLPVIMFLIIAIISWLLGSFWGTAVLSLPILFELAGQMDVSPILMFGVMISGTCFSAVAAFSCESILLCGQGAQISPAEVGLANLPYAILTLIITAVIFTVIGFVLY